MKRSEAIKLLQQKVIFPTEIIYKEYYDNGIYYARAERLLDFIETELGMLPPFGSKIKQVNIEDKWGQVKGTKLARVIVNEWDEELDG